MKIAGIVGYSLDGLTLLNIKNEMNTGALLRILLAISYFALSYNTKLSQAHMAVALLYLVNTFFYPFLGHNILYLNLGVIAYHLLLICKNKKMNLLGYSIALLVYLNKAYLVSKEEETTQNIILLLAYLFLIIYYASDIKEYFNEKKHKKH
jgi:hypothetical protein